MEEKKIEIIESIKKEIIDKQNLLVVEEVGSNNYNQLLNEIIILNKELNIIRNINDSNYEKSNKKLESIKNKYNFFVNLSKEELSMFLEKIQEYKDFTNNGDSYLKEIKIPEILADLKDKLLLDEITFNNISNSLDANNLVDAILEMKEAFKNESKDLRSKLRLVDFNSYNTLFLNVKSKRFSSIELLKTFDNLAQKYLIDSIIGARKELHTLKNNIFKTKKNEDRMKLLNEKILEREELLLKNINYYILNTIRDFENKTGLTINVDKENFTALYFDILDLIKEKENSYDSVLREVKTSLMTYDGIEKTFKKYMNLINPYINHEIKEKNIDVYSLNLDTMNDIIAQINIFNKLNQPDIELKEEEEKEKSL